MKNSKPNLPAFLGARICNDLIGPVSAISNGMELLHLSGDLTGPESELIDASAQSANARLRFFRLAFGQTSADQWISGAELTEIITKHYSDGSLHVQVDAPNDMPRTRAQLTILLLLYCETILSQRGKVLIDATEHMNCQGILKPERQIMWAILQTNKEWPTDMAPSEVHFALTREVLNACALQVRSEQFGQNLSITTEPVAHASPSGQECEEVSLASITCITGLEGHNLWSQLMGSTGRLACFRNH